MKKGISLVTLLVTIAVIITLVSTVVITGTSINNKAKKVKFASELSYVEEMLKSYFNTKGEYPILDEDIFSTENISEDILLEQFSDEDIIDNKVKLYQIDFSKLGSSDLTIGDKDYDNSDSVYLFSKMTGKVYYKKGYKVGKNIYYTLTDDLKKSINYLEDRNVNDGIIFNYNKDLVKDKIEIDIKIPISYTNITITSNDSGFISEEPRKLGEYYIYKTTSNSNSTITITYEIPEVSGEKYLKYNVNNVDNVAPTFNLSDIINIEDTQTSKKESYIKITNLSDNISGIKFVKYANKLVNESEAKEYFRNYGIEVNDNIIYLTTESNTVSIYVEDNAGNFGIKYVYK